MDFGSGVGSSGVSSTAGSGGSGVGLGDWEGAEPGVGDVVVRGLGVEGEGCGVGCEGVGLGFFITFKVISVEVSILSLFCGLCVITVKPSLYSVVESLIPRSSSTMMSSNPAASIVLMA